MRHQLSLIGVFVLFSFSSCSSEGGGTQVEEPEGDFLMNTASAEALRSDPAISDELASVLDEYFGQIRAPRYALLEEWEPLGFDPNASPLEAEHPEADPGGPASSAMLADNRRKWASELAALERDDLQSIGPWVWRSSMSRAWRLRQASRLIA